MKKGNFISETTYYVVDTVGKDSVEVVTLSGQKVKLSTKYINALCNNAHDYIEEVKISQTELINILISNSRIAMSVYFQKANKAKTKKAFNAEKQAKIDEIQLAPASKVADLLMDLMDNPILDYTPGDMRLIVGYHNGSIDERGRLSFVDVEDNNILKAVDPRTIEYVIVGNKKYIKK